MVYDPSPLSVLAAVGGFPTAAVGVNLVEIASPPVVSGSPFESLAQMTTENASSLWTV